MGPGRGPRHPGLVRVWFVHGFDPGLDRARMFQSSQMDCSYTLQPSNVLPLTKEFRQAPPYLRSWTMPSFALPYHPSPCHPSPPSTPSSFPRLDFFCRLIIFNIGHRFRGLRPPDPPEVLEVKGRTTQDASTRDAVLVTAGRRSPHPRSNKRGPPTPRFFKFPYKVTTG